jgi:hypothetical protein
VPKQLQLDAVFVLELKRQDYFFLTESGEGCKNDNCGCDDFLHGVWFLFLL